MTKIHIEPKYKDVKPSGYYVYMHKMATDGSIFYVGKGKGYRAWSSQSRRLHWRNVAKKHGINVEVLFSSKYESCAFTYEKILISRYRRNGEELVNICDGGQGPSGAIRSEYSIEKTVSFKRKKTFCSNGMSFCSTTEAAEWVSKLLNKKCSASKISLCARGIKNSAYGYRWSYYDTPTEPKYVGLDATRFIGGIKRRKPILCSNGNVFNSVHEASIWCKSVLGVNNAQPTISSCLTGRYNTAYGLSWEYIKGE